MAGATFELRSYIDLTVADEYFENPNEANPRGGTVSEEEELW